ncbi:MAG TPA: type II secretion system protein [Patescibacteria group bacterium]|nr:type II secretion system protein [Patescibacteria group bacterium]
MRAHRLLAPGFTLMELTVTLIIISVLSLIGMAQFGAIVEKSRTAEAKMNLGQIRRAQFAYFMEHFTYTGNSADLAIVYPETCMPSHWYSFALTAANAVDFTIEATRCTSGGKPPQGRDAYQINLDAAGNWSGTQGYY